MPWKASSFRMRATKYFFSSTWRTNGRVYDAREVLVVATAFAADAGLSHGGRIAVTKTLEAEPQPGWLSVLSACPALGNLRGNAEFNLALVFYPAGTMNRFIFTALCFLSATATAFGQIGVPESVDIGEVFECVRLLKIAAGVNP